MLFHRTIAVINYFLRQNIRNNFLNFAYVQVKERTYLDYKYTPNE